MIDNSKFSMAKLILISIVMGFITPKIIAFIDKKADQIVEKELSKKE